MFRFGDEKGQLKCSFCGKSQEQVRKLIAGPGVYICDECIELCNEIIEEELYKNVDENLRLRNIPKPKEINHILNQYVIGQERAKKSLEAILKDIDRDYYMTSQEAKDYGIIDHVIEDRGALPTPA